MAINLNNFVNVNINYHLSSKLVSTRDTVVLIKSHLPMADATNHTTEFKTDTTGVTLSAYDDTYTTFPDGAKDVNTKTKGDSLYYYYAMYFNNGGQKLRIISVLSSETPATPVDCDLYEKNGDVYSKTADTSFANGKTYYIKNVDEYVAATPALCELYEKDGDYYTRSVATAFASGTTYYKETDPSEDTLKTIVSQLEYKYIVITSTCPYDVLNKVAYAINYNEKDGKDIDGGEMKKFITHMTEEEYENFNPDKPLIHTMVRNYTIKYGLPGIEMTIAAYLSKINIDEYNSCQDYQFTSETVSYSYEDKSTTSSTIREVGHTYTDNNLVASLMKNGINVNGDLLNRTRNLGGNDWNKDEKEDDLVNTYMLILVNQTLAERLIQVLASKIKYNETGLSAIGTAIGVELDRYVQNGYISTNETWTEDDLKYQGTTIIKKGTLLTLGYKYVILPFSTLSAEDRKNHKLPTIYVLLSDSYSVRKIEVVGEVF